MVKSEKQRLHLERLNSNQKGENNRHWTGGRYKVRSNGYMFVLKPNNPNRNHRGYVREHILIMNKHIGRPLKKGEIEDIIEELQRVPHNVFEFLNFQKLVDKLKGSIEK